MRSRKLRAVGILPLALVVSLSLVLADGGANHRGGQATPIKLGTSGGNVNDRSNAFCCSGTLGALVRKGGTDYILSNNHVLGLSGSANLGDDVSQPGLIDVGCNVNNTTTVADFSEAPPLGGATNVDAAIAQVRGNAVSSTGEIIDVGVPSSSLATPALGMEVAKSGRTTGLTCGSISSISTDVTVQYQDGCGKGKKFTVTYTDQVVINSSSFSAGGDSGSLIVQAGTARPAALLYAGSSSTTIGNPILDVVTALGGITFVGDEDHAVTCPGGGGGGGGGGNPGKGKNGTAGTQAREPRVSVEQALAAKQQYARGLMQDPAVMGVGVGIGDDGEAVVTIFVEEGRAHGPLPQMMAGVRAEIIRTDRFRAWGWNEAAGGSCKAR